MGLESVQKEKGRAQLKFKLTWVPIPVYESPMKFAEDLRKAAIDAQTTAKQKALEEKQRRDQSFLDNLEASIRREAESGNQEWNYKVPEEDFIVKHGFFDHQDYYKFWQKNLHHSNGSCSTIIAEKMLFSGCTHAVINRLLELGLTPMLRPVSDDVPDHFLGQSWWIVLFVRW